MQYNIRDSQSLFWCFILIILRISHFLLMFCGTVSLTFFLACSFFFFLFCQNQGFCSHKIALAKKEWIRNIHNGKRQLFYEFFSFRKSNPPKTWVERKWFHFVHEKIYISLDKLLHKQKSIKEPFEF